MFTFLDTAAISAHPAHMFPSAIGHSTANSFENFYFTAKQFLN